MLEAGKREGDNTMSTVQNTLPEDNSMLSTKSSLQTTKDVKEEPHKTFLVSWLFHFYYYLFFFIIGLKFRT